MTKKFRIHQCVTGKRIKRLRLKKKWTQSQLALAVGVTARTVQNWERRGCRRISPASNVLIRTLG